MHTAGAQQAQPQPPEFQHQRESSELSEFIIGDVVSWALQLIFPFSHTNPGLLDLCCTALSLTETPQISLSSAVALLIWGCLGTEMCYQDLKKKKKVCLMSGSMPNYGMKIGRAHV